MILTTHEIEKVHSLSWAQPVGLPINCWVKFNHCRCELPYTASPADTELHGRELYQRIISGEFGPIQSFGSFEYIGASSRSPREIAISPRTLPVFIESISEANLENSRGTSRGIILVWCALLEISLKELLNVKAPGIDPEKSLGGKIAQLKRQQIITDSDLLRDLRDLKQIRNVAAHSLNFSSFAHLKSEEDAYQGYRRLYDGYASGQFLEVEDLLFAARFVVSPACIGSIERVMSLA